MAEIKNEAINQQIGAQGDNAHVEHNTFVQGAPDVDAVQLAKELGDLRDTLMKKQTPGDLDHLTGIGKVAEAEKEAKAGNGSKAIELLKGAGGWVLEIIKTTASGLLKDLIKDQLGGGGSSGGISI